ncbi:hypothetical protein GYMLUDRAFT_45309, partial [Collybiopsis luxurians FD-317 M1]
MMSFERLSEPTKYLIQICSHLHPVAIPVDIFKRVRFFEGDDFLENEVSMTEMQRFLSSFPEENLLYNSIDELSQFSLVAYDSGEDCLMFHSIIHECAHETTLQHTQLDMGVTILLGRATPLGQSEEDYLFRRQLFIHAQHIQWKQLPTIYTRRCMAEIFETCGYWIQAEVLRDEVLQLQKQMIGEHHPDTLTSMAELAMTYHRRGKPEEAEKLVEEVLLLRRQVIGEHHPDTLTSMNNLATTYHHCGKLEEAEKLGEKVLLLRKQVIGEHHPDTLTSMNNLAMTYRHCGKLEEAEKLGEEVLLLCKQVVGEYHPDTLTSMGNLAATYLACGKLQEADKLGEEVLLLQKQVIGEHHPSTLTSMNNLAMTYLDCGKLEEAEKLEEEVLLLRKQVIGEHHP